MSSKDPCAVYNFYNCCGHSSASEPAPFIWQSGNVLDPQDPPGSSGSTQAVLTPILGMGAYPDADLKHYLGLMPLHRKARLIEISLIKFPPTVWSGPPYTSTVMFNLVVLDYNGVVIRTISTAALNYQGAPVRTWIPIQLSTAPGDLDIPTGQLVAGELTFGAPLSANQSFYMIYQLSGTGMLL